MSFIPKALPSYDYLLDLFRSVDTNNSGSISIDELHRALDNGSWMSFNRRTVKNLMDLFDANHSGSITFDEFGLLWKYIQGWQNCFESFDLDNSRDLSYKELRNALTKLGYCISNCAVVEYLNVYDSSHTGHLSFDDFIQVCIEVCRKCFGSTIHDKICTKMIF